MNYIQSRLRNEHSQDMNYNMIYLYFMQNHVCNFEDICYNELDDTDINFDEKDSIDRLVKEYL
jgi:hypothetical protein